VYDFLPFMSTTRSIPTGGAVNLVDDVRSRTRNGGGERTLVLGGGIIGVCAAYYLARRGEPVTLIDRGAFDTCASTGNAGIIALGHPPMPRPGLTRNVLRMLFNECNPLYIPPRLDIHLLRWLLGFRRACTDAHFAHTMRVLAELGWATGECFERIVEEEGLAASTEYHHTGWIEVCRTAGRLEQARAEAELLRGYGYTVDMLSGEELCLREPAFLPGVAGAAHYTDSRFAHPQKFLAELADRASRHGAELRTQAEVRAIVMRDGRFSAVELESGERIGGRRLVLAGGAWSTALARAIGVNVPMQPGKGYNMDLAWEEPAASRDVILPSTTCVLAETFVAVTPIGGGLRLAGTVEFSGMNDRLRPKRLEMLRTGARRYLRGIDTAKPVSTWCGLRPCTADGLPIVGWAPGAEGVFIATGHAMMGFALGPVTGKLIAEAMLDGRTSVDLSPLSPERYARKRGLQQGREPSRRAQRP
jgi:D-amino-acid dehydrogenase